MVKTDNELRRDVEKELEWEPSIDARRIGVAVLNGIVTLNGDVNWDYQRRAAERAIRNLPGVKGISNLIAVKPQVEPQDLKRRIEETFKREATIDANRITVDVSGGSVTLRGTVRSWAER